MNFIKDLASNLNSDNFVRVMITVIENESLDQLCERLDKYQCNYSKNDEWLGHFDVAINIAMPYFLLPSIENFAEIDGFAVVRHRSINKTPCIHVLERIKDGDLSLDHIFNIEGFYVGTYIDNNLNEDVHPTPWVIGAMNSFRLSNL